MRKTSQHFSQSPVLCKVALVAIMLAFQALLGIGAGVLNAQTVKESVISGSDNEPLIGASVMVQGTKTGAVTDLDGNFTIEAKNGQTLEVSYLGFITQKVKVTGSVINVTLNEDKQSLDEVVVVGYGVQKKKLVTGANINVKGDDIAKLNTSNPLQALQGQTPGMSIISTSGQPGSGLKVNIRGMGTVSGSDPLYIIDAEACTIDADWLARVHEVVDYCIKNDLYVIINQHWDGGWIEHDGFTAATDVDATKAKLTKIWSQIANSFKNYDERLIFAGMNEPGVGGGDANAVLGTADLANRIAEYEQTFIEAVRATGGNNAKRVLVVQGPNTNIDNFVAHNYMDKIHDSATDRLMVEVHFYDPYQFTDLSEDKDWGKYYLYWGKNNQGGDADRTADAKYNEDYVEAQMEKMKTHFFDKGYPVLIGEFGANQRLAIGKDALHDASVKDYYKAVVTSAINNGCVPVAWDTNSNFPSMTIFNRAGANISNANMMESINAGVAAAKWPSK